LVSSFHKYKFECRLMYEHRQSGGEMPPMTATEKIELLKKKLVQQHEQSKCGGGGKMKGISSTTTAALSKAWNGKAWA
jgi:hypothetical protein